MPSFNKVILAGNLTRDPELRYTPSGVAIARIGLAINRTWRTESGETREEVTYVDVDCFRRQAETIAQYLKKGRPILVEGRLRLDQWDDKQTGQKRSRLGVVMDTFQFLDSGGGRGGGPQDSFSQASAAPPSSSPSPPPSGGGSAPAAGGGASSFPDDDDVPF